MGAGVPQFAVRGLGLRSCSRHAAAAYVASRHGTERLVRDLVVAEVLVFVAVFVLQAWVQLHLLQLVLGAVLLLGMGQVSL